MDKTHITRIHHPSGKLYEAWCAFVEAHPDASFFQSDAFFRLIVRWPGAEPVLLLMVDAAHQVQGALLAVIISEHGGLLHRLTARTLVYGGPLLGPQRRLQEHVNTDTLLKTLIKETGRRSVFIQFRNFRDWSDFMPVFNGNGFKWYDRLNLLVSTSKRMKAWKGLNESRRRQVKSSLKQGAKVLTNPTEAQVDAFYGILKALYKKKVKKPLPPRAFFQAFRELFVDTAAHKGPPAGNMDGDTPWSQDAGAGGAILLVEYQNRIIGGMVCPVMPGRAMCEWYVCGLDREMKARKIYPSVLVTWSAMEYAAANNIPFFDFLGMGTPHQAYGVRDFKARFGGEWVNHGRFMRINNRLIYFLAEIGYNIWRKQ